jgi:DNA-binding response OmpR family regulator
MRLLLVEDEERLADAIRRGLSRNGYAVDVAADGEEGFALARINEYDFIVLDLNLPKLDGVELCKKLRERGSNVPVLMLTARRAVDQRVEGLDSGADDYLTKPFAFEELLARLRALRRRSPESAPAILRYEDLELDPATMTVSRAGRATSLRRKEFMILELLLRRAGQVVSKSDILERAWDGAAEPRTNVVEAQVKAIRRAVDPEDLPPLLHTVRGVGYRLAREP